MPTASELCEHKPGPRDKRCKRGMAERARTRKRTTLLSSAISQCQRPIRCCARSLPGSSSSAVTACCRAICTKSAARQLSRKEATSSRRASCGHRSMSSSGAVTAQGTSALLCLSSTEEAGDQHSGNAKARPDTATSLLN